MPNKRRSNELAEIGRDNCGKIRIGNIGKAGKDGGLHAEDGPHQELQAMPYECGLQKVKEGLSDYRGRRLGYSRKSPDIEPIPRGWRGPSSDY